MLSLVSPCAEWHVRGNNTIQYLFYLSNFLNGVALF